MKSKLLWGAAAFFLLLFLAVGWFYLNLTRQASKNEALPSPSADQQPAGALEASATGTWQTVSSATWNYAMKIPPGYHFSESASVDAVGYVLPDPTADNGAPAPVMSVTVADVSAKGQFAGKPISSGGKNYWLARWEDKAWPPYDAVVASFTPPPEASASATAETPSDWETYSSPRLGFSLQLPPGYFISETDSDVEADVMPIPSPNGGELPVMRIRRYPKDQMPSPPAESVVSTQGDAVYVMSLWEDSAWVPFAQVAASLKTL